MMIFTRNGKEVPSPIANIAFPNTHMLKEYKISILTTSLEQKAKLERIIPQAIDALINDEEASFDLITTSIRADIINPERNRKIFTTKTAFIEALENIISKERNPTKRARLGS